MVKDALRVVDPLVFNAVRFLLAGVALAALHTARGRIDRRDLPALVGLGICGHTAYQAGFIFGLDRTLAGNAAVILAAAPIWTLALAVLVGQEPSRRSLWWAAVLGLSGIGLVIAGTPGGFRVGSDTWTGDLLMLGASACWAGYTVAGRNLVLKYGAMTVTTWAIGIGGLPLVLAGVPGALTTPWGTLSGTVWLQMGYAGLAAIAAAYVLWYKGVEVLGSASTALWSNLVPCVAILVAWLWLGEEPSLLQLTGAGLVLFSVGMVRRRPAAPVSPRSSRG